MDILTLNTPAGVSVDSSWLLSLYTGSGLSAWLGVVCTASRVLQTDDHASLGRIHRPKDSARPEEALRVVRRSIEMI